MPGGVACRRGQGVGVGVEVMVVPAVVARIAEMTTSEPPQRLSEETITSTQPIIRSWLSEGDHDRPTYMPDPGCWFCPRATQSMSGMAVDPASPCSVHPPGT